MRVLKFKALFRHLGSGKVCWQYAGVDYKATSKNGFVRISDWCQFTGKEDINETEVYDGDKIKQGDDVQVIFWHEESSAFYKRPVDSDTMTFTTGLRNLQYWEVIGNIHEDEHGTARA